MLDDPHPPSRPHFPRWFNVLMTILVFGSCLGGIAWFVFSTFFFGTGAH